MFLRGTLAPILARLPEKTPGTLVVGVKGLPLFRTQELGSE